MTSTTRSTRITQWILLAIGPVVLLAGTWWLTRTGYQSDLPEVDVTESDFYVAWALFFVGGLAAAMSVLMWFRRHHPHWFEELVAGHLLALVVGAGVAWVWVYAW